jgi:uncharacterized membrane protein YgcG
VVALSAILFALTWTVVFGQMWFGQDPVLGSGAQTIASKAKATKPRTGPSKSRSDSGSSASSSPTYYIDPVTGEIYLVPGGGGSAGSAGSSGSQASSTPAPVITSSS